VDDLLISNSQLAKDLLIAALLAAPVAELVATFLGRGRGIGGVRAALAEGLLLRGQSAAPADRRTKPLLVLSMFVAVYAAVKVADDVALTLGANDWSTFVLGIAAMLAGIALRSWGIVTLGRFFRREVVVVAGQHVVRRGPYRWIRHPAYAGNLLLAFGLGLALGSWVGSLVCTLIAFVGHLPRIRVEEAELTRTLGAEYATYADATARLVPGVW
jgi:protein-S-isoprenylcysteine O-methyltransferase Ste14